MVSEESKPFLEEIDSLDDRRLGLVKKTMQGGWRTLFDSLCGILFCVLDVPAEESVLWMDEGSMRSHGQTYCPFLVECGKIRGILCSIQKQKETSVLEFCT
jgi:hypothetical protein